MDNTKRYYITHYTGKLEEVDRKTYQDSFNNPYVTLWTEESNEMTIDQLTLENEHEDFPPLEYR